MAAGYSRVTSAGTTRFGSGWAWLVFGKDGKLTAEMDPEKRFFPVQQMPTSVTAIHTNLLADLYVALGDSDGSGGWTIRAYWKPLVPWIWIGAVFMALGGLLSLSDRRWRIGVAVRVPRGARAATAGD